MSEPERSDFLPRWARDGRWELGEFPDIGAADEEDDVSEPMTIGQVIDELERLKAMKAEDDRRLGELRAMLAELRKDLETDMERFDRETGHLWLYGSFAFLGIALLGLAIAAFR